MEGFYLLCGHMAGDYLLQNDFLARWKAAKRGEKTAEEKEWLAASPAEVRFSRGVNLAEWADVRPDVACTLHCLLYTLAVWACSWWWMPGWGLAACFLAHWVIDRSRLARLWMDRVSGQKVFAAGPLAPWSVIVIDQCFHLLTLGGITALAGRV